MIRVTYKTALFIGVGAYLGTLGWLHLQNLDSQRMRANNAKADEQIAKHYQKKQAWAQEHKQFKPDVYPITKANYGTQEYKYNDCVRETYKELKKELETNTTKINTAYSSCKNMLSSSQKQELEDIVIAKAQKNLEAKNARIANCNTLKNVMLNKQTTTVGFNAINSVKCD